MKLHLGCGGNVFPGYLNIDSHVDGRPEEVYQDDAIFLTRFREEHPTVKVDEIVSYHLFEHLPRPGAHCPNVSDALKMWHSLLRPGGRLIIECPNFQQVVEDYVAGNKKRIDNIFGLNRFPGDTHQFGYTPDSIAELLKQHDFGFIEVTAGTDYHTKFEPCMRVEARKLWNSFVSNVVI